MSHSESKWPWFERKFEFQFPPEKLPDIVERLRGTSPRVNHLLSQMDASVLCKRIEGSWSIQENIGHLLTLEPLWLGRVEDILTGNEKLRDADLTNSATVEADYHDSDSAGIVARFAEHRKLLVARLETLGSSDAALSAVHPRLLTSMRVVDLAFFVAEHDDYHLARMMFLKRHFILSAD